MNVMIIYMDMDVALSLLKKECQGFQGKTFQVGNVAKQGTVAELIEGTAVSHFVAHHGATPGKSRRSIDDFLLGPLVVDVKTHWLDTDFYQPNLISADRLCKLYAGIDKMLVYIFIHYTLTAGVAVISEVEVRPVETISWSCLSIQCQGLGVVQLKNNVHPIPEATYDRPEWTKALQAAYIRYWEKQRDRASQRLALLVRLAPPVYS